MTEEQRYLLDLWGYLHIKSAFSGKELTSATEAAKRYVDSDPTGLPDGFGIEGKRHLHGFAFDKSLERLATHASIWPIIKEITKGRPRLTSGTLQIDRPNPENEPLRFHCARDDYGWDAMRWDVRDGRVFCNHIVAFPYLTDVNPGDGGLLVVPGSHKSNFERPPSLFDGGKVEDWQNLPDGVVNITPKAGDVVIMSESVTHGALPWRVSDRLRMYLVLRYHPQYVGGDGVPDEIVKRLSPETQELVSKAAHKTVKEIVKEDSVLLS
jgi:ectoine hydroxylase-related dioxygenase (phytanoyl-CoA dioxygenase family)